MQAWSRGFLWDVIIITILAVHVNLLVAPSTAAAKSTAPEEDRFWELMRDGNAAAQAKHYPEAVDLYAEAYLSLPPEKRTAADGEVAINSALKVSQELLASNVANTVVLRDHIKLFQQRLTDLGQQASAVDIEDHLAKLQARLEELEPLSAPTPTPTPVILDPSPAPAPEPVPAHDPGSTPAHEATPTPAPEPASTPVPETTPKSDPTTAHRVSNRDVVWLSLGATAFVGGVAMIGGGGYVFAETRARANAYVAEFQAAFNAALATPRTEQQIQSDSQALDQFVEDVRTFRDQSRARATTLVVLGSVLASAGIGVSTWTLLRIRRDRRRLGKNALLTPGLTHRYVGLNLSASF